jgi:hypothetical protein
MSITEIQNDNESITMKGAFHLPQTRWTSNTGCRLAFVLAAMK